MKRLALICTLAACRDLPPAFEPTPDAPAYAGPRVKVAAFNVRRFFDTVCDSGACADGDYEAVATPADFAARAQQIADAIHTIDPDVISLEEIEDQNCIDALLADLGNYQGVLGETGGPASVDVAILAKTPIEKVTLHRADTPLTEPDGTVTSFARELLEVQVHVAGTELVMFAAHFKAKSNDDPARRLAEAQAAAVIVNARAALEPDAIVVLGGDLNDHPGSPPIDALTLAGGLIRLADDLPTPQQSTYVYKGQGESIDHLLLAPNGQASARIPMATKVWLDGPGYAGSDHRAISSELKLP